MTTNSIGNIFLYTIEHTAKVQTSEVMSHSINLLNRN